MKVWKGSTLKAISIELSEGETYRRYQFANDFGLSIAQGPHRMAGEGTYEVAVIWFSSENPNSWVIIARNQAYGMASEHWVAGYQSPREILKLARLVSGFRPVRRPKLRRDLRPWEIAY